MPQKPWERNWAAPETPRQKPWEREWGGIKAEEPPQAAAPAEPPKETLPTDIVKKSTPYFQKVAENVSDVAKGFYKAWKGGDVPEMFGLSKEAMGPLFEDPYGPREERTYGSRYEENVAEIPLLGGLINKAAKQAAGGDVSGAAADMTTGVGLPLLVAGSPIAMRKLGQGAGTKNWLRIIKPTKAEVQRTSPWAESRAERVAGEMAEGGMVAGSEGALQRKLKASLEEIGPQIKSEVGSMGQLDVLPLVEDLDKFRREKVNIAGTDVEFSQSMGGAIDYLQDTLSKLSGTGTTVDATALWDLKKKIYRELTTASGKFRHEVSPASAAEIEQAFGRSVRRLLDQPNPRLEQLDALYGLHDATWDFLENSRSARMAAEAAIERAPAFGSGHFVQRAVPRFVVKGWESTIGMFNTVPWNTVSSYTKTKIANAIATGEFQKAATAMSVAIMTHPKTYDYDPATRTVKLRQ